MGQKEIIHFNLSLSFNVSPKLSPWRHGLTISMFTIGRIAKVFEDEIMEELADSRNNDIVNPMTSGLLTEGDSQRVKEYRALFEQ